MWFPKARILGVGPTLMVGCTRKRCSVPEGPLLCLDLVLLKTTSLMFASKAPILFFSDVCCHEDNPLVYCR